jgi:hypothetical protein
VVVKKKISLEMLMDSHILSPSEYEKVLFDVLYV